MVVANHTVYITKASCGAVDQRYSADGRDVDLPVTEADDSEDSHTVFIEDVPSDLVEYLELHLESRNKGGGVIEKVVHKNGGILVTFEELQGLMSCHIDSKSTSSIQCSDQCQLLNICQ